MNLLLSDIVDVLLNPFTWTLILFLLAFMLRKKKAKSALWYSGLAVLLIFSNSFLVDEALRSWENRGQQIYKSRVLVVLGGGLASRDAANEAVLYKGGSARLLQALDLCNKYPISHIIISGGSGDRRDPKAREASLVLPLLRSLDLVPQVIAEDSSRNTYENARNTAEWLQSQQLGDSLILISSAIHLPRAMACFRKQGLIPEPCPVGRMSGNRRWTLLFSFQPASFTLWQELMHEMAGMAYYKLSAKA
jgi:uncharacterized SAM-binding protein YcdF (DUF218 family)